MSHTRTAGIAAIAALALGGSLVASTATADAHTYSKVGSVSAKEASKLFKEVFKQKCLTVHEARHIAHGSGELYDYWEGLDEEFPTTLTFVGTKKSHIAHVVLTFPGRCADSIDAYKR